MTIHLSAIAIPINNNNGNNNIYNCDINTTANIATEIQIACINGLC